MQQQQNYSSGILVLILLMQSLFGAFDNPLMLWITRKENGIVFHSSFPHRQSHGSEGKRRDGAAVDVSNQTMQTLTGGFKTFLCDMTG